ncbi:unnamed protein product, partial [Prorocentrum cordatum]
MPARGGRRRFADPRAEAPMPACGGAPLVRGARGVGVRTAGDHARSGGAAFEDGLMTRDERTSPGGFAKTKMCKFFILGTCAKGTDCR